MKNKVKIPISKSYRFLNFGPVVLVTSARKEKRNVAAIAWSVPLSSDPVLVGIAVYHEHFTARLISQSGEFAVNIPPAGLKEQVVKCGSVHGFNIDKFEKFRLTPLPASRIRAPLVGECFGHLECKLVKKIRVGDHWLFIGKVVAALADKGALNAEGVINLKKFKTLQHLGGDNFATLREVLK